MDSSKSVLEVEAISKRFGATVALSKVSFALRAGEVCGLLGENGAGKSTLVKCLTGMVRPDSGNIRLRGEPFRPRTIVDANAHGISTAFQELSLVPTLSVAVNLFLPRPKTNAIGMISTRRVESEAMELLRAYGVDDISPGALVGDLPLGMRQRVEIVRALSRNPSVLLLDEPTAALADREWLFRLIDRTVQDGTSILYISHKLDEIRRLCRRCVILRNGQRVLDSAVSSLSDEDIFTNMAGRSSVEAFVQAPSARRKDARPALKAERLTGPGIDDVSFEIAPGEIVGMAGLEGHGQSQLFKALVGLSPLDAGTIALDGTRRTIGSPRNARRLGLVLVPEERKSEGIFGDLTTSANISLPVVNRTGSFNLLNGRTERRLVEEVTPAVNLSNAYLPLSISALSGGNQQKAVLARALITGAQCLLLFDPTRGVDVGAKQNIYTMMQQFAQKGGAILFYSTELDELTHLCDRCLVLYRNAVAGELKRGDLTQDRILSLASGHVAAEADARPEMRP